MRLRIWAAAAAVLVAGLGRATVPTTTSIAEYTCNGTTKVYAVPYRFLDQAHLRVSRVLIAAPYTETVLALTTDYTVGGAGLATGGTVTLVAPVTSCASSSYKLRIRRITPRTQSTGFSTSGSFNPKAHEAAFDRQMMIAQELNDQGLSTSLNYDFTGPSANSGTVTAVGGNTARRLDVRFADTVNVADYGAAGDNLTNDTTAVQAALAALGAAGGVLIFPAGTFLLDPTTFNAAPHNLVIRGSGQGRGGARTTLKSRTGGHVIEITGAYVTRIEISNLRVLGNGGTGHGIYFHNNGPYGGPSHLLIKDVTVEQVGGKGVYMVEEWHSTLENVSVDLAGDNAFELQGGNTTTLIRCYAHQVAAGKVGFRIYGGAPTLIACNGIDSGSGAGANWGLFGSKVAEGDATTEYFRGTLLNCNVEDFLGYGIRLKEGSTMTVLGTSFIAPTVGTVKALTVYGGGAQVQWGSGSYVTTKGAAWTNAQPIHSEASTIPPVVSYGPSANTGISSFYADGSAITVALPLMTGMYAGYVNGSPTGAVRVSALRVDAFTGPLATQRQTVTYSASMTFDASTGNEFVITATNTTAFTINAPTNPATGQRITVRIRNGAGAGLGVATWGTGFKMSAWVQPGAASSRSIDFQYDGTNWIETARAAADVPN